MRINAYVLAATPHWLAASVSSYYDIVSRIVVSYDENERGWNRKELPVSDCIEILKDLDVQHKMEFIPGHFSRQGYTPFENQTHQRQIALNHASDGADWVLQLDTDEVIPDSTVFMQQIEKSQHAGADALYYPSRWLYQHIRGEYFLERSTRFWRIAASFPGPLAVKAHSRLQFARQTRTPGYRVDFRPIGTDCWSPSHVDSVIPPEHGIIHYAWVRTKTQMALKAANHGDLAKSATKSREQAQWEWCGRYPLLAVAISPVLRRFKGRRMLRFSKISPPNKHAARELSTANILGDISENSSSLAMSSNDARA